VVRSGSEGDGELQAERRANPYPLAALAIATFAVAARLLVVRATHSTTEDFFITLRYAENIAHGNGFVYNPGGRVLGTTTPLYTLYLALATWLGANPITAGKAANILADGVTVFLIATTLRRLGRPRAGLLAALLYAGASTPINFSIGGMETGLVTLAGAGAINAYVARRPRSMFVWLGLLFLLRIDGLLLAAVLTAGWMLRREQPMRETVRRLTVAAVPGVILVLPWVAFAWLYFGSPIPVSMLAKVAVYGRMFPQPLPNLPTFITQFWAGIPQKALLAAFVVGSVVAIRRRELAAPLVWLLVYYAAMLVSKVIAFGWYFMPPLPVWYIVAALGVAEIVRRFAALRREPAFAASMALLAMGLAWHLRSIERDISAAQRTEDAVRLPIGLWLRDNAAPTERVLLEPIGYIGYYSRLPVLDMIGLVSPEVLPSYERSVPNPLRDIVTRFRPELLLLRPSEADAVGGGQRGAVLLGGEYTLIKTFRDADRDGITFLLYKRARLIAPGAPLKSPAAKE